jgi:membrane-bound lytic murein transglycosylase B
LQGHKDIIRSLASLAFLRSDRELYKNELVSALTMLEKASWPREKLQGSWAGAMGGPQFLPSAYLKYAVAYEGGGQPDIWTKPPDIFASIAHFLKENGWVPGLRWGYEVALPGAFGFENLHQDFADFSRQGLVPLDGSALPAHGQATLYLPAGAKGPAFLLSDNYWVFKVYNNSDAYALSAGLLANRINGSGALHTSWPKQEQQEKLSRSEKMKIQQALSVLGLYQGSFDGKFGQASRDAIHAFQIEVGHVPADGYATRSLIDDLKKIPANAAK